MDLQERIARALCSKANLPENIIRQGRPMWMDFLGEAEAVRENGMDVFPLIGAKERPK